MGYPFHQPTFGELVEGMDECELADMHKEKVEALMVYDPKRKALVPSRFCSFHLAGFDLDEKSTAPLGPPYEPDPSLKRERLTEYVAANERFEMADSSIDVISVRVVRASPAHTYPVEVYGKIIARDEVDHKCVYLFDRERKDAQLIKTEKDMLALTGPYRALVTLGWMYFEFDLRTKGKGDENADVPFSKGVISYYYNPFHKRIISQLPSFHSTVKLVLQRVSLPVAASIEVNVVGEGQDDSFAHYHGKITAGTTKDYKQHMVLYDSSVPSSRGLVSGNGSLVLNRNLVAVKGFVEDRALEKDEKLVLYVCFLGAGCEIEDEDKKLPAQEDDDEEDDEDEEKKENEDGESDGVCDEDGDGESDEVCDEDGDGESDEVCDEDGDGESDEVCDEDGDGESDEVCDEDGDGDGEEEEEHPKNVVTLRYPQVETVWEYGSPKLQVKVNWTVVRDLPEWTDFFHRYTLLPKGYKSPDYRHGGFY
uniref:Uncharacterized protein n=1 Tax=Avena sativa TaxID=4498 RepID=A0ACD5U084_AVESA